MGEAPAWLHVGTVPQEPRVLGRHEAEVVADAAEDDQPHAVDRRPRAVGPRHRARHRARRRERQAGPSERAQVERSQRLRRDERVALPGEDEQGRLRIRARLMLRSVCARCGGATSGAIAVHDCEP
eukprot:6574534-Prymnesium_polylepis.2